MRSTVCKPLGTIPKPIMRHGARPIPMCALHIKKCGRNCGIRKGRPIPSALPHLKEDLNGEAAEFARNKQRAIKFSETMPTRQERSAKFERASLEPLILRSPPTKLLKQSERLHLWADEGVDDDVQPGDAGALHASESYQLELFLFQPEGTGHEPVECRNSVSPTLSMIPEGIERQYLEPLFKKHAKRCGPRCGRRKGKTQPVHASFAAIMEDVKGEEAATTLEISVYSDSESLTETPSTSDTLSPSESKNGQSGFSSSRGLVGLGFINMPELSYTLSMSTGFDSLATPPESPVGYVMDCEYYHSRSPVTEWKFGMTKKMRAKMFVEDVGYWVKRRMGRQVEKVGA